MIMLGAIEDFSGAWAGARVEMRTKTKKSLLVISCCSPRKNERCGIHDCIARAAALSAKSRERPLQTSFQRLFGVDHRLGMHNGFEARLHFKVELVAAISRR